MWCKKHIFEMKNFTKSQLFDIKSGLFCFKITTLGGKSWLSDSKWNFCCKIAAFCWKKQILVIVFAKNTTFCIYIQTVCSKTLTFSKLQIFSIFVSECHRFLFFCNFDVKSTYLKWKISQNHNFWTPNQDLFVLKSPLLKENLNFLI